MRFVICAAALLSMHVGSAVAADAIEVLSGPAAAGEGREVKIAQMKFQPGETRIKAGSAVVWVNTEALPHNVQFESGPTNDIDRTAGPMLRGNQKYAVRFNKPGTYTYICTPHPFMKGTVIVE